MQCPQCGRPVPEDALFCSHCGERMKPIATSPAPAAAASDPHPAVAAQRLTDDPTHFGSGAPPEEQLWSGRYSPKAMYGSLIGAAVVSILAILGVLIWWRSGAGFLTLFIGLIILWGIFGLTLLYRRANVSYRLTRYRLFHENGILGRTTSRLETIDIDDVTVQQTFADRMLNIGTIIVRSSDRTEPELRLRGIEHVNDVADLIDNTRRAERQRRGLHLEST
jgi:membrane protein YdbS with pleckstrin-like domain